MKEYRRFEINYRVDEQGGLTAQIPAIPGCIIEGSNLAEAYQKAVEVIESRLQTRGNQSSTP